MQAIIEQLAGGAQALENFEATTRVGASPVIACDLRLGKCPKKATHLAFA